MNQPPVNFAGNEPMLPAGSVSQLLDELKAGSEDAASAIWNRYFGTLVTVARNNLSRSVTHAADEEDVALSAFHSLIRGFDKGNFAQLNDRNDLWRLLLVITLRKASDQITKERRQKRGGGKVLSEADLGGSSTRLSLDDILSHEPTPEMESMVRDEIVCLMNKLEDPVLQQIALAKMEGCTDEEIAQQHGCVRRTVVRKLAVIRQRWADRIRS